jgi:hypothetical protein
MVPRQVSDEKLRAADLCSNLCRRGLDSPRFDTSSCECGCAEEAPEAQQPLSPKVRFARTSVVHLVDKFSFVEIAGEPRELNGTKVPDDPGYVTPHWYSIARQRQELLMEKLEHIILRAFFKKWHRNCGGAKPALQHFSSLSSESQSCMVAQSRSQSCFNKPSDSDEAVDTQEVWDSTSSDSSDSSDSSSDSDADSEHAAASLAPTPEVAPGAGTEPLSLPCI